MKLERPKTKEQAIDQAIQIDKEISEKQNISYYEIITISEHFEKVGKKFGLLDEFRENGII